MATNELLLRALCPEQDRANFSLETGCAAFRRMVAWIEDTKIRHYKIEERSMLRNIDNAEGWQTAYRTYLEDLQCPFEAHKEESTRWLLSQAIGLDYKDDAKKYNAVISSRNGVGKHAGKNQVNVPFPDVESEESIAIIEKLAAKLKIDTINLNDLEKLKRIKNALQKYSNVSKKEGPVGQCSIHNLPLGFSTGDGDIDLAALILRALYIKDLRALQSLIDETIVKVQEFTANPVTDAKLGRVGR